MNLLDYFFKNSEKIPENEENSLVNDFSNFSLVTQYLYDKSGITELDKRGLITNKLKEFAKNENIYTTDTFLTRIKNDEKFYQNVINIITVHETYFFREMRELQWLTEHIKHSSSPLKILSMPCSSGEEVYSILLMLSEAGVDMNKVEITGYDISSDAIEHAKEGLYNKRALHKIDADVQQKYFTRQTDDLYSISPILKEHATFYQKNIFEILDEKGKYDIVLSRNLFIYFDDQKRLQATDIIIDLLKEGGIFIKGHADYIKHNRYLKNIKFGIYQKV